MQRYSEPSVYSVLSSSSLLAQLSNSPGLARSFIRPLAVGVGLVALVAVSGASAQQGVSPGAVQPNIPEPIEQRERTTAPSFEVPALIDRPLGEDEGPRLLVKSLNIEESPKFPPSAKRNAFVGDILNSAIENQGSGMTIGQLQAVADQLTEYYRGQGYMLARAYVPMQDAQNGAVVLKVLEGSLGEVAVEGNDRANANVLSSAFSPLLGKVIEKDKLESALLLASDIPGSSIYGVLRPGTEVGTADVALKVQSEDSFEPFFVADNYGTESTGEYRGIAGLNINNAFELGDRIRLLVLQTASPGDSLYGSIGAEVPLWRARLFAGFDVNYNDYAVSEKELGQGGELEGTTRQSSAYLKYKWLRSKNANLDTVIGASRKKARLKLNNAITGELISNLGEDDLGTYDVKINWDSVDSLGAGAITRAKLAGVFGSEDFPGAMADGQTGLRGGAEIDSTFQKYELDLLRVQRLTDNFSVSVRLEGQYSDDILSSLEQYSVGGPANVRAFPVSEALGDKAVFGSIELTAAAPGFSDVTAFGDTTWGDFLQFSIYYDAAEIEVNFNPLEEKDSFKFMGAGLGIQLRYSDFLYFRFDVADPDSSSDSNEDDQQYWVSLNLRF